MANIGEQLLQPEAGWRRIDDTFYTIKYSPNIIFASNNSETYNLTNHTIQANDFDSYIEFYFYGTKLRIVGQVYSNRSKK